jgi:PleD family two-component response regulator
VWRGGLKKHKKTPRASDVLFDSFNASGHFLLIQDSLEPLPSRFFAGEYVVMKVLVADDSATQRRIIIQMLKRIGYSTYPSAMPWPNR